VPSAAKYKAWATQNETHSQDLLKKCPQASDWAVTVLFYVCLHEVNAFLRARNVPIPGGHAAMKTTLYQNPAWQDLAQMYELFQGWSNRCRYKLWMPTAKDVQVAQLQLGLVRSEIDSLNATDGIAAY